jgi:hypothetical protein
MEDLLIVIVAGVEVIFSGSEMLLEFLNDTEIFGATLYGWFLGYLVLNTIITIFIPDNKIERLNNTADFVYINDMLVSSPEEVNDELD